MGKHTPVMLSVLLLLCFGSHVVQCRTMEGMYSDDKINFPNGLCARSSCDHAKVCYCCFATGVCYWTMDDCKRTKCGGGKSTALDAATTRALPTSRV
ncbi:unnamed protein product [Alopecurus aequalis]